MNYWIPFFKSSRTSLINLRNPAVIIMMDRRSYSVVLKCPGGLLQHTACLGFRVKGLRMGVLVRKLSSVALLVDWRKKVV